MSKFDRYWEEFKTKQSELIQSRLIRCEVGYPLEDYDRMKDIPYFEDRRNHDMITSIAKHIDGYIEEKKSIDYDRDKVYFEKWIFVFRSGEMKDLLQHLIKTLPKDVIEEIRNNQYNAI